MNTCVKHLLIFIIVTGLVVACGKKDQTGTPQDSTAAPQDTATASAGPDTTANIPIAYVFFNIDSLQAVLEAGKHKLDRTLRGNPDSLKYFLNTLPANDPASIPYAIHFIKNHPAPAGSPVYDTIYKQFSGLHYLVSEAFSRLVNGTTCETVLSRNHVGRTSNGDPLPQDPELKNLIAYLNLYSLKVYMSEGSYYTGPDPELFYNVFHRKASASLIYYLTLQKKDLKEGLADDNMLLISYSQLYERIEAWGLFIATQPANGFLQQEAMRTYRSDLSILLHGLGNTVIFDTEKETLNPEIKTLYENIIAIGKDPVSKKIITDYYSFLAKNDFKKTKGVNTFLNQYNIASLFTQLV